MEGNTGTQCYGIHCMVIEVKVEGGIRDFD